MMPIRDQVALVTGAASGIGRAAALLLASQGARIVAADRNLPQAQEVCAQIEREGGLAHALEVDVGDPAQVKKLVDAAVQRFERIDALVHSAGICPRCPVLEMSDEAWHDVLRVNLDGTFYVARDVARVMMRQRAGTIILLTSDRGVHGSVDYAHYAAAKGGTIALVKSLAMSLGQYNVTVNGINPGMTDTPLGRAAVAGQWEQKSRMDVLGGYSRPEEIAQIVLFLAETAGTFMTGQIVGTRMRHGA
ncbi:MAG TPA: SDR family NAD(P)-dependent oxidoreductase [Casimicrobiaceae bacterium]|nr:SDR family NAD(P)-dependent oxidoreductase [Casimicrobiaceae bacterium]